MKKEEKAQRARAILEDVVFQAAIDSIRERQFTAFENSTPEDTEVREQSHKKLWAINQLRDELQSIMDDYEFEKGRHREDD